MVGRQELFKNFAATIPFQPQHFRPEPSIMLLCFLFVCFLFCWFFFGDDVWYNWMVGRKGWDHFAATIHSNPKYFLPQTSLAALLVFLASFQMLSWSFSVVWLLRDTFLHQADCLATFIGSSFLLVSWLFGQLLFIHAIFLILSYTCLSSVVVMCSK